MANTIVELKKSTRKSGYKIEFNRHLVEIFVNLKLPIPRWILNGDKEVVIITEHCNLYSEAKRRELRDIFGKRIRIVCVKEDEDAFKYI